MNLLYLKSYYLIPVLALLAVGAYSIWKMARTAQENGTSNFARLRNFASSLLQTRVRLFSLALALLFLSFALLRPQWGQKSSISEASGIDVVFALDVSKSMQAMDLSAGGNKSDRLMVSKALISDFVNKNQGNRYGLVVFAGEAFVSTPLTFDNAAFLTFLEGVGNADVAKQGTDLGEALKASLDRFVDKDKEARGKAIVLLSDGGEEGETDYEELAKLAKADGISIYAIGMGSDEGVPIPESTDFFGRVSYKMHNGETVLTKLNDEPLKDIADITGGKYFHADEASDMAKISKELEDLPRTTLASEEKSGIEDRYQLFLLPAFVFFLIFIMLPDRRIWPFPLLVILFLSGCQSDLAFRYHNQKGNEAYRQAYYDEAIGAYEKARASSDGFGYLAQNNSAVTDYAKKDFSSAFSRLQEIADGKCGDKSGEYCDWIYYNLGNTYYRVGEVETDKNKQRELWEQAIKAYESDLEINKEDKDAQENIDFIKEKLAKLAEQQKAQDSKQAGQSGGQAGEKGKDGEEGKQGEGDKKDGEEENGGTDGQNGEKKEGESDKQAAGNEPADKTGQEEGAGQAGGAQGENKDQAQDSANQDKLDENTAAQVQQYMQQMEQAQGDLQRYFRQNKNEQNQGAKNIFEQMFNDPFFGGMMGGQLSDKVSDPNEKDW